MLKLKKKRLKVILKLLPNYHYIKLKKNGELIIKKFIFSLKSYRVNLFDFLLEKVPEIFDSAKLHKKYMKTMEQLASKNDVDKAIETVSELITFNTFTTTISIGSKNLKEVIRTKLSNLLTWARDKIPIHDKNPEVKVVMTVHKAVSKAIKIGQSGIVGMISTGNPLFDEQFRSICRYNALAV